MTSTEQLPISGQLFHPEHEQEDYNRLLETARASIRADAWLRKTEAEVLLQRRAHKEPERFDAGI